MRPIDADALDDVMLILNFGQNRGITRAEYKLIESVLFEFPTIDAVPVIRCKDCKWSVEHYDTDENVPYWTCVNFDVRRVATAPEVEDDGYCYLAERKEE